MKKGDLAPDFTLFSDAKKSVNLTETLEKKPVVLLFFPAAFTGTCTTELNDVNNDLDGFQGAAIFGISTDAPFTLAEYSKVNGFSFPLLSDHDSAVSAAYGTKYDHDFTGMKLDRISKRSAFVIDQKGVLQYVEVLEDARQVPDLDAIKLVIKTLI